LTIITDIYSSRDVHMYKHGSQITRSLKTHHEAQITRSLEHTARRSTHFYSRITRGHPISKGFPTHAIMLQKLILRAACC